MRTKVNRNSVIEIVETNPNIIYYLLQENQEGGATKKIAEKDIEQYGNELEVFDPSRMVNITQGSINENLLIKIGEQIITDEYITDITKRFNLRQDQTEALKSYKGKTLTEALDLCGAIIEEEEHEENE